MRSLSLGIVLLVARCAQILGPPGLAAASASQNVVQNLPALLLGRILPKAQLGGRVFQWDATTTGGGGPGLGRRRRRRTQSQIRNKGFDLPLQGLWSGRNNKARFRSIEIERHSGETVALPTESRFILSNGEELRFDSRLASLRLLRTSVRVCGRRRESAQVRLTSLFALPAALLRGALAFDSAFWLC